MENVCEFLFLFLRCAYYWFWGLFCQTPVVANLSQYPLQWIGIGSQGPCHLPFLSHTVIASASLPGLFDILACTWETLFSFTSKDDTDLTSVMLMHAGGRVAQEVSGELELWPWHRFCLDLGFVNLPNEANNTVLLWSDCLLSVIASCLQTGTSEGTLSLGGAFCKGLGKVFE